MGKSGKKANLRAAGSAVLAVAWAMALASGCATRGNVYSDYREIARETPAASHTTTVVILVDGLSAPALRHQINAGRAPRMREYFLRGGSSFALGRAVFPTLTYPNISSILTASPVDAHPIIGNQVLLDGKVENFESPLKVGLLNRELAPRSVFTRLKARGEASASLAQYFGAGATVEFPRDIKSGLAYLGGRYEYIDDKSLEATHRLLDRIDPERWPSLIFVHLVDVDSVAHEQGPMSKAALDAIEKLDARLGETFEVLSRAQVRGKKVVTILTADHGFVTTPYFSDAARRLARMAPEATVINGHRMMALHFPVGWSDERKARVLAQARMLPGVELTMLRLRNDLWVNSATGSASDARIRYYRARCAGGTDYALSLTTVARGRSAISHAAIDPVRCPEAFDLAARPYYYPYFVSNAASYFHAPGHPDAVILATPGVSFTRGALGQHGGMTPEETLVPVLLRGARIADSSLPVPTRRLLELALATPAAQLAGTAPIEETIVAKAEPLPADPRESIQQELVLASPVSRWWVKTEDLATGRDYSLSTPPTLGLSGEWHQYWNSIVSTSLGYQFSFAQLQDSADATLYRSGAHLQNEAFVAGAYHFGPGEKLILRTGARQQYFPHRIGSGEAPAPRLDREWIPEIGFGSKNRVLSLGIGDVFVGGNLAFLLPRDLGDYSVRPGFREVLMVGFARAVGTTDTASAALSIEHQTQNTSLEDRSGLVVSFSMSYGLTFKN